MSTVTSLPPPELSLDELCGQALMALRAALPKMVDWTAKVRPADGSRGRFRWAVTSTREANVPATAYILSGTKEMGIQEQFWTAEDRAAGAAWIRAMHQGGEQYRDPALLHPKTPGWQESEPWPSPAMLGGINGYARNVLRHCLDDDTPLPPEAPPPGWPQPGDSPESILEWIKTRPYDKNAWGACSHGMRMATFLWRWHQEGRYPLAPVLEALRFFYSIQDPVTGLWGTANQSPHVRINGTFKLFPLMRDQLDLPVPHADKIIDQVMAEFARPNYDTTVGACDEWDNWYVLALARPFARGHREAEIRRLAAWRIQRVLTIFQQADGGLSYGPHFCTTGWIGFDMAPPLAQGDAMGPGILVAGINVCIDLLGLQGQTPWTGKWHLRPVDPEALRAPLLAALPITNYH